jgi:putative tryptophan/tyrosine transport system substrate-binding protein
MGRGGRRQTAWAAVAVLALLAPVACGGGSSSPQSQAQVTIGILRAVRSMEPQNVETFLAELASGGYAQGRNLRVHGADPGEVHPDPQDAEAVVRTWAEGGLDLVLALSSSGAMAAARAAPGVKVLFLSNDPMAVGLVTDERRPEANLTGATFRVPADRTVDVARRLLPGITKAGLVYPTSDPAAAPVRDATVRAGAALNLQMATAGFATADEVGAAIEKLRAEGAEVLLLANAPTTVRNYPAVVAILAGTPMPVIANTTTDFALAILEPDTTELYRQMGRQAVRLLQGSPVSDVPVEDPARFRLTVNLKVAAALGIEVPADVVRTADHVVRP